MEESFQFKARFEPLFLQKRLEEGKRLFVLPQAGTYLGFEELGPFVFRDLVCPLEEHQGLFKMPRLQLDSGETPEGPNPLLGDGTVLGGFFFESVQDVFEGSPRPRPLSPSEQVLGLFQLEGIAFLGGGDVGEKGEKKEGSQE